MRYMSENKGFLLMVMKTDVIRFLFNQGLI